jgi:hypothetical protein
MVDDLARAGDDLAGARDDTARLRRRRGKELRVLVLGVLEFRVLGLAEFIR